jgi:hypothetical protein
MINHPLSEKFYPFYENYKVLGKQIRFLSQFWQRSFPWQDPFRHERGFDMSDALP